MKKLLLAAFISLSSISTAAVAEVRVGIILVFTGPIADGRIDKLVNPIPIRAIASNGLPAISQHKLRGVPVSLHWLIMSSNKFKPDNEMGSYRSAIFVLPRSLANKN